MSTLSFPPSSVPPVLPRRIVLVTGPSGAGRSSALNVLEDAGFEAIDNLPLRLLPAVLSEDEKGAVALGIDVRNRDFSTEGILEMVRALSRRADLALEVLFLECQTEVLLRRFSETRRRHPLAHAENSPAEGIEREQLLLRPLKQHADVLIDTSTLNIHQLRTEIEMWFAPDGEHQLAISVQSFSYKRGLPRSVDMVFDCRFLRNPHWEPSLRPLNGTSAHVAAFIAADPLFSPFAEKVFDLSKLILPASRKEGKSHICIAFGCTGGQHRSVSMAEDHALRLAKEGWQVSIRHRELERQQGHGAAT